MDKLLLEYADMFNENFPIFAVAQLGEEAIKDLIKESIDKKEPFNADYIDDAVY